MLRVSGRFELWRVRVTEGIITVNVDGNPGEIDFGSSSREVRASEDSSYPESTVISIGKARVFMSQNAI